MTVTVRVVVMVFGLWLSLLPPAFGRQADAAQPVPSCLDTSSDTGTPYFCTFKVDDNSHFSICMVAFRSAKTFLMSFADDGGGYLTCACEATGTFGAPRYHKSKTFICGDGFDNDALHRNGDVAVGTLVTNSIMSGQYMSGKSPYHTYVYKCVPDPGCSP